MKNFLLSLMFVLVAATASAKMTTQEFYYYSDEGIELKGYLAFDASVQARRPAVIVVHEWWGQNDYVRKRAEMLAELGYVGVAIDMYGKGRVADHPQDAKMFSSEVMGLEDVGRSRFQAALTVIRNLPFVDPSKIAAIGYCFGGSTVLNMARLGEDLKGVVSFHGSLASKVKAESGKVKAKVLVCHGAADDFIAPEAIDGFVKEMKGADVSYQFKSYPNAKHGFTNPAATENGQKFGLNIAYDEAADQQSWEDMKGFLASVFVDSPQGENKYPEGHVDIKSTTGSDLSGRMHMVQAPDGLEFLAEFFNVPGPGLHAFHIHENGSCDDGGKAAGGHFNPMNSLHGLTPRDGLEHAHAGDMGNVMIDEKGHGLLVSFLPGVSLTGGKINVEGKSVILHEKEDDFSQPTGNAGGRIGCGIIRLK